MGLMNFMTESNVNNNLFTAERVFNVLGWIPGVSAYSGGIRWTAGNVMLVAAVALTAGSLALGYATQQRYFFDKGSLFSKYIWHAGANIVRGAIETLFIIGNILAFCYDASNGRMRYPGEPSEPSNWSAKSPIPLN